MKNNYNLVLLPFILLSILYFSSVTYVRWEDYIFAINIGWTCFGIFSTIALLLSITAIFLRKNNKRKEERILVVISLLSVIIADTVAFIAILAPNVIQSIVDLFIK